MEVKKEERRKKKEEDPAQRRARAKYSISSRTKR
jgi:hypothetical protein